MSRKSMMVFVMFAVLGGATAMAGELAEQLQPLKPFLEKTWKGSFEGEPGADQGFDIARWERALNGQAVRILHSINDGEYGGETLIVWDQEKEKLIFYYFTTAGFYTQGTITLEGGKFISHEMVTGAAKGVTEVKAVSEIGPDGIMRVTSKYLKDGSWVDGHTGTYVEAPDAKVIFR
jgi:hypothetical protein